MFRFNPAREKIPLSCETYLVFIITSQLKTLCKLLFKKTNNAPFFDDSRNERALKTEPNWDKLKKKTGGSREKNGNSGGRSEL